MTSEREVILIMAVKTKSMLDGDPINLILKFAGPMLIGNIFQQAYNFADSAIVGRYVNANALASIGATSSINFFLIAVAFGLTNGAGIIIAQCFGGERYERMKQAISSMVAVLVVLIVFLTAIGIIFATPFLRLLNVPDEILPDAAAYMRVIFIGLTPMMTYNVCSAIMRSLGDSKTPLYMLIVSALLNIGLDLVFILVFSMGVIGAGIATVISQIVSAVLCLIYLNRNRFSLHINDLPRRADRAMIKSIIRIGLPSAMQSCLIALGGMCVQGLVNSFGSDAIAANTASSKIDSLTIQVVCSLAASLSVFAGQNMGAGRLDRLSLALKQTLWVMLPVCLTLAILIMVFKEQALQLMISKSENPEAIRIGAEYLSIIGIGYIIAGVMQSYQNLLRGVGDVNVCVVAGIVELSVRVIASYIFVRIWGLTGIWYAVPFSWGCGCLIPIIRYYSGKWKFKSL